MEKVSNRPDEDRDTYDQGDVLASSTSASVSAYDTQSGSLSSRIPDDGPETNAYMTPPHSVSVPNPTQLDTVAHGRPLGRIEKLRQKLAAMLPCQEDVDCLSDSSYGWWLMQRHMLPNLLRIPEEDLQKPFDVSIVSASHPMIIARLLLCVALCIQQLPPDFDPRRLQIKGSLREMMERNVTTVAATVTYDDELTGSMEGIECFSLQGLYQVIAGNFRRAWLSFRKAINVAQLMGLHRVSLKTSQEAEDVIETRRHYMWYHIIQEVRHALYCQFTLTRSRNDTSRLFSESHLPQDQYHSHSTTKLSASLPKTSTINIFARSPASYSPATKGIRLVPSPPPRKLTTSLTLSQSVCRQDGGKSPLAAWKEKPMNLMPSLSGCIAISGILSWRRWFIYRLCCGVQLIDDTNIRALPA